jgi:hypothetical protein
VTKCISELRYFDQVLETNNNKITDNEVVGTRPKGRVNIR